MVDVAAAGSAHGPHRMALRGALPPWVLDRLFAVLADSQNGQFQARPLTPCCAATCMPLSRGPNIDALCKAFIPIPAASMRGHARSKIEHCTPGRIEIALRQLHVPHHRRCC